MSRDRFRSLSEYDDTLGGLIPSIGAQVTPGLDGRGVVLPETEDFAAYGYAPGAQELANAERQRRRRRAQEIALQNIRDAEERQGLQPLFNDEGEPMIQPERGLRRQLGVRPRSDVALDEFASSPGVAAALGMGDVLIAPRLAAGLAAEATGGSYEDAQDDADRLMSDSPWASAAGAVAGALPLMGAGPLLGDAAIARLGGQAALPAYAQSIPALARVGAAGLEGLLWGGAHEAVTDQRVGPEAALSGGLGAGMAALPVIAGEATRRARPYVGQLEEAAKRWRVRAAGGRTIPVMRAIDALDGGIAGVADDLDALGISPRYSVHSVDDAREVADRVRGRAGRNISRVFDVMEQADADDAARFAREMEPVQARDEARRAALEAIDLDDPSMLLLDNAPDTPLGRVGREIYGDRVGRHRASIMDAVREHLGGSSTAPTVAVDGDGAIRIPSDEAASAIASPRARRRPQRPSSARTPENLISAMERDQLTDAIGVGSTRPEFRGMRMPGELPQQSPDTAARLRQMVDETLPAIESPRPAGTVNVAPVADAMDEAANVYRSLPSGDAPRAAAESAAAGYRGVGGRMAFGRPRSGNTPATGAQGQRMLLDEDINFAVSGNPVTRRVGASESDLRAERQLLQRQMDEAVTRVNPELGAAYPRQRREYQIGKIFGNLGEDSALREAANRQISPTDYVAAMEGDSMLTRARNVLLNRLFRGREASLGAAGAERLSDALRATPDLSRPMNAAAGRIGRMAGALERPEVLDEPHVDEVSLGLPPVDDPASLPVLRADDTASVPEFSPDELRDFDPSELDALPELSDEELRNLPVLR